jgi:arylsulfatase B
MQFALALALAQTATAAPANVLIVVADDLGVDKIAAWEVGVDPPQTPTVDSLIERGARFGHAWAAPSCSSSRAMLQTGRYPWRTGIGRAISPHGGTALHPDERTLAELVLEGAEDDWSTAYIGKWHLGSIRHDMLHHPMVQGWENYQGAMGDLGESHAVDGLPMNYFDWEVNDNGSVYRRTTYNTTALATSALDLASRMPEPWLLVVAFNAPHAPWHEPPAELVSGSAVGHSARARKYNGMVEALDTELGRLLDGMGHDLVARTNVFFLGDNGTPGDAVAPPLPIHQSKGSLFEGGIRVPLVAAGPDVAGGHRVINAPTSVTDLYATLAELSGIAADSALLADIDGVSFAQLLADPSAPAHRTHIFSEQFPVTGRETEHRRAIFDGRYKLIEQIGAVDELYDLDGLDHEADDLMLGVLSPVQRGAWLALKAATPFPLPD